VHDYIQIPYQSQDLLSSIAGALARRAKDKRIRMLVKQFEDNVQHLKEVHGYVGVPKAHAQVIALPNNVSLDLARRIMWRGSTQQRLTPIEARLLEAFVSNWGRVISHTEIVLLAQGFEVAELEAPEILRPLISRLRKKLKAFGLANKWISSVRGIGYVFDADIPERSGE